MSKDIADWEWEEYPTSEPLPSTMAWESIYAERNRRIQQLIDAGNLVLPDPRPEVNWPTDNPYVQELEEWYEEELAKLEGDGNDQTDPIG